MGREVILQNLFPGCKEAEVWNKSNGFIINCITNEGDKWVARILTKRLVGIEASTYLSHQWAAVVAKLSEGTVYAWALWVADKFKDHYVASQMSGHNFPMPSLHVVLRQLNDGPKASKKMPKYIKKQWREIQWTKDDQATYASVIVANVPDNKRLVPVWPHPTWIERTILDFTLTYTPEHFSKEPYSKAWSLPDLPRIPLPELQRKEGAISPKQRTSEREGKRHKLNLSQTTTMTIPLSVLDDTLTTQSAKKLIAGTTQELATRGTLPPIEQATLVVEALLNIRPYVHLLREKTLAAREPPPIPLEAQARLTLEVLVSGKLVRSKQAENQSLSGFGARNLLLYQSCWGSMQARGAVEHCRFCRRTTQGLEPVGCQRVGVQVVSRLRMLYGGLLMSPRTVRPVTEDAKV
eukprot:Gb_28964 [translate_table: standard]